MFWFQKALLQKRVKIIQGKKYKDWRAKIYILQGMFLPCSLSTLRHNRKNLLTPTLLYWWWRWLNRGRVEHFCDCGLVIVALLLLFYLLTVLGGVGRLQQHRHQVVSWKWNLFNSGLIKIKDGSAFKYKFDIPFIKPCCHIISGKLQCNFRNPS